MREISDFKLLAKNPEVSVMVLTYNHSLYIEECLRSVLNQRCNFTYEVVIAEDCSPDDTLSICLKCAQRYKSIVRIITDDRNVGMMRNLKRGLEACRGQFIAVIEGDDYWVDEKKLQMQFDALLKNEELGLCFTRAQILPPDMGAYESWSFGSEARPIEIKELFDTGYMQPIPTASSFFRRKFILPLPHWFEYARVGDIFLTIAGTRLTGAWYLPVTTCCYRYKSIGSWTSSGDVNKFTGLLEHNISLMKDVNQACADFNVPYKYLANRFASNNWIGFLLSIKSLRFFQGFRFLTRIPFSYFCDRIRYKLSPLKNHQAIDFIE
jgi:glycosyltransferase involved in cell wall biosynthesis